MAMTARGYPMSSPSPGPGGGGTFGTNTGRPGSGFKLPPMPANDNLRRVGRSFVPSIRGTLGIGRFPWLMVGRNVLWYLRTNGDYDVKDINPEGWTLACGAGSSGHLNRLGACPPGPQFQQDVDWDWGVVTISTTKTQVMNFFTNKGPPVDVGGNTYHWGDQTSRWTRTYPSEEQLPLMIPGVIPARWVLPEYPVIPYFPHIDPETIPIQQPVPTPMPIPHRLVPRRVASPGHDNRPARGPNPVVRKPDPHLASDPGDDFVWQYIPGRGRDQPNMVQRPGKWIPPKPPGRKTDERKFALTVNASNVGHFVGRVFGSMTEVIDFIDSLYWAIPKEAKRAHGIKRKSKYIGWDERAKIIWELRHKIDWNKAFDNLMENELEDRLIGTLGRGSKRLAQKTGSTHGFAIGPTL